MRIEDTFTCSVLSFFNDHFFPKIQGRKKMQFFSARLDLKQAVVLPPCLHNESVSSWG